MRYILVIEVKVKLSWKTMIYQGCLVGHFLKTAAVRSATAVSKDTDNSDIISGTGMYY